MTHVAVVILNWNGLKFIKDFLPSVTLYSDNPGAEIIVADNYSDDGSVEFIKKNYPDVRIIRFEQNYGFAGGYHKALQQIKAKYFVLLNSDVEVTPGWLSPLIKIMEEDSSIAACMPKIKAFNNRNHFEYAGAAGGFIDWFGYPFCRGRILDHIETDNGQYDNSRRIFWASGACLAIRSSSYFEAGGFDDLFFAHMEEIDLCWRIHGLGKSVYCIPDSIVYHVGGGSLPNNNPRKIYLNYRNNLFLLLKNLPAGRLLPVIFVRMMMDIISAIIYLLKDSGPFFTAVVKAHLDFYKHIPVLIRSRKDTRKLIAKQPIPEVYKGSIVFDYFIRKKRIFPQLRFKEGNR